MSITKAVSKIKTFLSVITFIILMVKGLFGWTFLIKETILAVKEARARRRR